MSRLSVLTTTICTVAVVVTAHVSVSAQGFPVADSDGDSGVVRIVSHARSEQEAPGLIPQAVEAKPIKAVSTLQVTPVSRAHNSHPNQLGPVQSGPATCYPQLNAPLYPSPQPNTPLYSGGTQITNQAMSPHEMLYPHQYKALYGPYYYKVHGRWFLTPWGVRSHDTWELQGTEVNVKYRSHFRPFSFYFPPVTR